MESKGGLVILIVVLVALGAFYYWWAFVRESGPATESTLDITPTVTPVADEGGLGSQLQVDNPAGDVPETNPFEAETNPFEETQTNPFENNFNPF